MKPFLLQTSPFHRYYMAMKCYASVIIWYCVYVFQLCVCVCSCVTCQNINSNFKILGISSLSLDMPFCRLV